MEELGDELGPDPLGEDDPLRDGAVRASTGPEAPPEGHGDDGGDEAPFGLVVPAPDPSALHLRSGRVNLEPARSLHRSAGAAIERDGWFLMQLDSTIDQAKRERLRAAGVELGQYLPSNAFVVRLPKGYEPGRQLAELEFVRWVGEFDPDWKLSPELGTRRFVTEERQALAGEGMALLSILTFDGRAVARDAELVSDVPGVTVTSFAVSGEHGLIEALAPIAVAPVLAGMPPVQWIEEAGEWTLRNGSNAWILQSGVRLRTPVWDRGLHGEGQIAGIIDGGLRLSHCAFRDVQGFPPGPRHRKIVALHGAVAADPHGTHVAGILAGDERPVTGGAAHRGLAHQAKFAFISLRSITSANLNAMLELNHQAGARVHSNSWGDDGTRSYNAWARDIDLFSWRRQEDLVLVAATNREGRVRNPENAKNCLAVAASRDAPHETRHAVGGHATTVDGRLKPEVLAPGEGTSSASSAAACGFARMTGTSMACPAAAAAAILVRQYFMEGWHPTGVPTPANAFTPTGALLKAMLINSAVDMTGVRGYPSAREGWGRVLLDDVLAFSGDLRDLKVLADVRIGAPEALHTGMVAVHTFTVASAATPLKVTMVFTDKEAALNARPAAVNDLDLEVWTPSGALLRGNVFRSGESAMGGVPDLANNVEQVYVRRPEAGTWTVRVVGAAVNTREAQGFALVATGDFADYEPEPAEGLEAAFVD